MPESSQDASRLVHLSESLLRDSKETFRFAAAFRGRIAKGGTYQASRFQPLEPRIYASDGNLFAAVSFEITGNRHPVSSFAQVDDCEKEHEFERAEIAALRH